MFDLWIRMFLIWLLSVKNYLLSFSFLKSRIYAFGAIKLFGVNIKKVLALADFLLATQTKTFAFIFISLIWWIYSPNIKYWTCRFLIICYFTCCTFPIKTFRTIFFITCTLTNICSRAGGKRNIANSTVLEMVIKASTH